MPATEGPPFACDLILKGGITSGIVYPPAIVEIARDHRFKSIGGASAGAIAAASAAAAELGRDSRTGGFELLARVPDELAATDSRKLTLLRRLFVPQDGTSELFDLLWTLRSARGMKRVRAILSSLSKRGRAPAACVAGAVIGLALAVIATVIAFAIAGAGSLVTSIPLVLLVSGAGWGVCKAGALYVGAKALAAEAPQAIAANYHGLCNGSTPASSADPGLTDWLYQTLQALAGRNDEGVTPEQRRTPVTYGELRTGEVQLVTITTDISHGTSEEFPLGSHAWAFNEAEMRALFPAEVVDHLVERAEQPDDDEQRTALEHDDLRMLPVADDIPIILGARISLSFPILLSALPLYAWEPRLADGDWERSFQKCWFSDGGITSNLPVHLFDRPLPTRPTYAINLGDRDDTAGTVWENLWRPLDARSGPPAVAPITSTPGLLSAVFSTMQNWADNSLARAAGMRERICMVRLGPGEGGMNLDMPPETIRGLVERGGAAGKNLAWMMRGQTPAGAPLGNVDPRKAAYQWNRHRFTRYRIFLGGLGRYLDDARSGVESDPQGHPSYAALSVQAIQDERLPYRKGWTTPRESQTATIRDQLFAFDTAPMVESAPKGARLGYKPRSRDA